MSERVFIIHGRGSKPDEGWIPWLNNELSARGMIVRTPAMPNSEYPDCNRWLRELATMVGTPDEHTHFAGHSLGVPTILRYLQALGGRQTAGTVVMIGGFAEDIGIPDIRSFVDPPFDFTAIRPRARRFVNIHSDADSYISSETFASLTGDLGAEDILVPGAGHFSASEGHFRLPQALSALIDV